MLGCVVISYHLKLIICNVHLSVTCYNTFTYNTLQVSEVKKSAAASVAEEKQAESNEETASCSSSSQPLDGFTSASQVYSVSRSHFVLKDRWKCKLKMCLN